MFLESGGQALSQSVRSILSTCTCDKFCKEVRVKIVSQDVPTLDLVDLPGLALARNNLGDNKEPDNISELTVESGKVP